MISENRVSIAGLITAHAVDNVLSQPSPGKSGSGIKLSSVGHALMQTRVSERPGSTSKFCQASLLSVPISTSQTRQTGSVINATKGKLFSTD